MKRRIIRFLDGLGFVLWEAFKTAVVIYVLVLMVQVALKAYGLL